jgi:hypothetical protein
MLVFLLLGAPIAMLNEVNHIAVLLLLHGAELYGFASATTLRTLVPVFLDLHGYGVDVAAIFWGLWLFPMGYLVLKSAFLPQAMRIAGILLMTMGCFGYLIQTFAALLFPHAEVNVVLFTGWVEVFLPLWLLIKGVDGERWAQLDRESACGGLR